jgi:hypothetical protein
MSRRARQKPTLPVGSRVLVPFPWHKMEAVVVEHRGFIGVGGREMVRIQPLDQDDLSSFEVPVEEIEVAPADADPMASRTPGAPGRNAAAHIPVGTRVRVQLPHSLLDMVVVEDRGTVDGRQIVRVRSLDDEYVHADLDVAVEDVEVLSLPPARRRRAAA